MGSPKSLALPITDEIKKSGKMEVSKESRLRGLESPVKDGSKEPNHGCQEDEQRL